MSHDSQKPKTPIAATKLGNLPSRGRVICIFDDHQLRETIEAALVTSEYGVLRARHGMHGYWLSLNSQPDVIVTDITGVESSYLLDCLNRNPKTATIPVLALFDSVQQSVADAPLRNVTACMTRDSNTKEIMQEVDRLIASGKAVETNKTPNAGASTIDAYFSELGHETTRGPNFATKKAAMKKKAAPSPNPALGNSRPHAPIAPIHTPASALNSNVDA